MAHSESAVEKAAQRIIDALGSELIDALVLVGSHAREEAISGVSDVEFLLVTKPHNRKFVAKAIKENGLSGKKISIGITTQENLKRFRPLIFTIEAKRFGKVLYGDNAVLDLIPAYLSTNIETLDGFILLNNRIVEQLNLWLVIQSKHQINEYEIYKGYVQLANSLLAFNKSYRSLYEDKTREIKKFAIQPELVTKIDDAVNMIKSVKLKLINSDEALKRWEELRSFFKETWLYEAASLLKKKEIPENDLIEKFVSIVRFKDKVRGWIKVLKVDWSDIPGFKTSPQFAIYQQAIKLYFSDTIDPRKAHKIINAWERFVK